MKVKKLIEELQKFDPEIEVDIRVFYGDSYTPEYEDIVSVELNKTRGTLLLKY